MAIGDFTPKKLLQKALDTTASNSQITVTAGKRTIITSISVANISGESRIVSVFLYGTATTNKIANISLVASGTSIMTGLDYVLIEGETASFNINTGSLGDVNIAVMGIEEEI